MWSEYTPEEHTAKEADGIRLLGLREGSRVLDAPCGYGRISGPVPARGDGARRRLTIAPACRRPTTTVSTYMPARLRILRPRPPPAAPPQLVDGGFDAAVNIFTSLGYGSEADDLAILSTLAGAVRPGGRVLVETMHRDLHAVFLAKGMPPAAASPTARCWWRSRTSTP